MNSARNTHKNLLHHHWSVFGAFAVPLAIWLGITGFGLWREQAAGVSDLIRRLQWNAETAAETVRSAIDEENQKWSWAEIVITQDGRVNGACWFDPTPLPGNESPESMLTQQGEYEEIAERNPGALSPAGLPLGPIAAFRLLTLSQDDGVARRRAQTVRELCFAFPSVVTPELLDQTDREMARRGLADSNAPSWQDRWSRVSRVARAVDELAKIPAPKAGPSVVKLDGAFWKVDARKESGGTRFKLVPLEDAIRKIAKAWSTLPSGEGIHLAMTSACGDLLDRPRASLNWKSASIGLDQYGVQVLALGDPAAVAKAAWLRITILGGGCVLAAVMLTVAWWRQQHVARIQTELARQKDDFLSTVSHELRTPAASIQLLAENLHAGTVNDPESIRCYHEKLLKESRRLVSTTEQLLDFALTERGFKRYRFLPLDCALLADEIRQTLTPIAAAKEIGLHVHSESIEPPPHADFDAIRRVILNLGDNAIKFSKPSGRVEILMSPLPPENWFIRVTDHGLGIPVADQHRIFERFYRGGDILNRETRGTGIGLALVTRIIESHQGTVELTASSEAGSVFTCVLPLHPAQFGSPDENPADRG